MKNQVMRLCCLAAMVWNLETRLMATDEKIECTKEELMMFFPPVIVKNVLLEAKYSQDQAEGIAKDLVANAQKLSRLVDEKAEKQNPNPFKDLSQRDQALKIYQETLFEVFASVLKAHAINDENEIRTLLDRVRTNTSRRLIECINSDNRHMKDIKNIHFITN